jgi:hypothetical protein
MLLFTSEVSSIDALMEFWEWIEYMAEVFVIVGCVGEYLADFTKIKTEDWRHHLSRASLIVLTLALAIELVALVRTNNLSGKEIALLNAETASANERAKKLDLSILGLELKTAEAQREAESAKATAKGFEAQIADAEARVRIADAQIASANAASKDAVARVSVADTRSAEASAKAESFRLDIAKANERTAQADLARRQLEMQLTQMFAPRVLSDSQKEQISSILRAHKTHDIDLWVFGDTPEINTFSGSLIECMGKVWPMNIGHPAGGGQAVTGVLIGVKTDSDPEISAVAGALVSVLRQAVGNGVGLWDFDKMITPGAFTFGSIGKPGPWGQSPIKIFVGAK